MVDRGPALRTVVGATAGLAGVYVVADGTLAAVAYIGCGAIAIGAIVSGLRTHRPSHPEAWWLIAGAVGLWAIGDALWFAHDLAGLDPFPSLADAIYLAAYPVLGAGLLALQRARTPGRDVGSLLDAAMAAVGTALLVWALLPSGAWAGIEMGLTGRIVAAAYPLGDLLLLTLAVRLTVAPGQRPPAFRALQAALGLLLIVDLYYTAGLFADTYVTGVLDLGWLASYGLFGVAALHPTMRQLSAPVEAPDELGRPRLVLLWLMAVAGPTLVATRVLDEVDTDLLVLAVGSVLLFSLAMARMVGLAARVASLTERRSEDRFRALVENARDVVLVLGPAGDPVYASPSLQTTFGLDLAELGPLAEAVLDSESRTHLRDRFHATMTQGHGAQVPVDLHVRTGADQWRQATGVLANHQDDPAISGVLLTLRDVTEERALREQLAHRAYHDSLTGLPNRALFLDRVEQALARRGAIEHTAVLFLDLDEFKVVNDSLGHSAGDELLCQVARLLDDLLRAGDTAARLGGDEFAVLLTDADVTASATVAQRLVDRLARPFRVQGAPVAVSASLGIARADGHTTSESLLRDADAAMYAAKRGGKNRVQVFDPSQHAVAMRRLQLRTDLARHTDDGTFRLEYQPIVTLDTGQVDHFEALLRWDHPQLGAVRPDEFVPIAEHSGAIVPLGAWSLRTACTAARRWNGDLREREDVGVAVNVSAHQLHDTGFADMVASVLADTGLPGSLLHLELTEHVLVTHDADLQDTVLRLHALGVSIAIDDFGTGYSSLAYLERYPIDAIKIDRVFVARLGPARPGPTEQPPLAPALIRLAQAQGLATVAEGIETSDQLAMLRHAGCEMGQGWLFAPPLPEDEARALASATRPVIPVP